jgi:hypothetical protein
VKSDAVRPYRVSLAFIVYVSVVCLFGDEGATKVTVGGPVSIVVVLDDVPDPANDVPSTTPEASIVTTTVPSIALALETVKVYGPAPLPVIADSSQVPTEPLVPAIEISSGPKPVTAIEKVTE